MAGLTFIAGWGAAVAVLLALDPANGTLALSTAGYALLLWFLTWRIIPAAPAERADDVLRASGPPAKLRARIAVAALTFVWLMVQTVAAGGATGGIRVPLLTPLFETLGSIRTPLHDSAIPPFHLLAWVIVPGALLVALGANARQLGLTRPARGSALATLACCVVPLGMLAWAMAHGRMGLVPLFWLLVHNLLSNGFSEEFVMRGVIFSHVRALLTDRWALVAQAFLFALPHLGDTLVEEHFNLLLAIANVVGLNAPIGLALGFMALRSRSLVMPTIVHVSLDTMARLV
ncbi:MAG TPA: CPBP family intramembrane glutamic endopeptidase [Candidatus Elarobacter sp.]|nr:CPBP family intramembrane glutamic endopeptidase [Candidatus Elarobacter sp.]